MSANCVDQKKRTGTCKFRHWEVTQADKDRLEKKAETRFGIIKIIESKKNV